ncbi:MAG TPA: LysR family transcriptional regulator [Firmicutes bacterium]|nr:LysR family transcriptional regulator [Candidatus Fermentithermobacillaceae bacterium]
MFVNLDLYRVFHYVARLGSISRASEELYVSQPAVSQSIKRLEEQLGVRLLIRTPRGVRLTQEGETLYQHISQAYSLIEAGERRILEVRGMISGEVRIGASDTLCKYYLAPHLEVFHRQFPGVHIHVTNRTTPETIELLRSGKVDIGLINLPIAPDPSLVVRETITVHDCFVTGTRYLEKYPGIIERPIPLEELLKHPLLMLETASNTRRYIDRWASSKGVTLNPEVELGSIDLLLEFAGIGLGIAAVVREFAQAELASGRLKEVRLQEPIPPRRIGIVTLKNVGLPVAASRFVDLLLETGE